MSNHPRHSYQNDNFEIDQWGEVNQKREYKQWIKNGPGIIPSTEGHPTAEASCYTLGWVNERLTFIPVPIVNDNLIALPDSKSDEVISEIDKFWKLEENYKNLGYAYKRGFLLWGPPGSGKTATIVTVCRKLVVDRDGLVVLIGKSVGIADVTASLRKLRQVEPKRPLVIVMEDLDTLIKEHGESELLSLLDGEASIEGAVFLATTNYPEDLDGRVKNRPSRFDRVVEIGPPNDEARKLYFRSRMKLATDELIDSLVAETKGLSIAHCKEIIIGMLCLEETPEQAIKRIRSMSKQVSSTDGGRKTGFGRSDDDD